MGVKFNPLIFSGLDFTGGGGTSIGTPIGGADPNSVLITDNSSNLADVPMSTGQLLIGRTSNTPIAATLTGTANRVIITSASGSITLSLPQDIATTSSPTFANLNLSPSGLIDLTTAGTLAIGTGTANIINIGNSGATINIQGNTFYQNVTDLNVADKNITVNHGGSAGSASNAGIQVEENALITAYIDTTADRLGWELKAPATAGVVTFTPGASGFTINQGSHDPVTLTAVGSSPNANGASLSSQALTLQPANGSNPGLVTSGTQTFGGAKTFNADITATTSINFHSSTSGNNTNISANATADAYSFILPPVQGSANTVMMNDGAGHLSWIAVALADSYITGLTGDGTASGPGSVPFTLATVNSNTGSFGTASSVGTFTVNGKGLITAASSTSIQITESQVTNLTSDLALKAPLASPTFTGTPAAPTASQGNNSTRLATTAYVDTGLATKQNTLTIGNLTDAGTDGIVVTGGTGAVIGTGTSIAQHVADTTHNGYLSSTDWNTFNGKQASGNYITALTGDITASGPGSVAATLATVNSNVGSFTYGSFTVNAKGLITAASSGATPEVPLTFSTGLTRSTNTITVNTSQNITNLTNLNTAGFVKTTGTGGALSIDTNTYLTGNQTITLSGDITGSGTTAITGTLATVNSNVGSFTNANITVNGKGLITAASNGSGGNLTIDTFSGDASTTAFTLSVSPGSVNNAQVYISGVYQPKSTYSISSTTLTFGAAPPSGTSNIQVVSGTTLAINTPGDGTVTYQKFAATTEVDNGNSSTSKTISFQVSDAQKLTLTGNCTLTFTNTSAGGAYVLRLVQDGTGSRTVTWPSGTKWPSGTAPTLTTTAGAIDIISFYYDGTNYYGNAGLAFA